jgi:hypothetical protein
MIIKTNLIPKGFCAFTFYPFIFVRPASAEDPALLAHEMIHYREQKKHWTIPWVWKYFTNKQFRLQAELRGYAEQVRLGGVTTWDAVKMLSQYQTGKTPEELSKLLLEEIRLVTVTPNLYRLVGSNGQGRIELFRQTEPGWDHGEGLALSHASLKMAEEYCEGMRYCMGVSVFMSQEGHLVLSWCDPPSAIPGQGQVVEVEFGGVVSVFIERTGEEFRVLSGDPRIPIPPGAK